MKNIKPILLGITQLMGFTALAQKPNVLIILADDQRDYGTIHANGGNEVITPNIDQFVKTGTTYTNSYIMGGSQGAVSVPSRNMLLTGRNLFSLGSPDGKIISEKHTTLGECLANAGYSTYGIGKWHNDRPSFTRTFQNGADIFFGGMSDQFRLQLSHYDPTGNYNKITPLPWDSTRTGSSDHYYPGKHSSEIFRDAAVNFIDSYNEKKPFFLYVSFTAPHDPRSMPPKYLAMYDTANIQLPVNFMPKHPFDNGELKVRDEKLAAFPRTPQEIKCHIRDYYAMMTHLDDQVGLIVKALKEKGLYENTIIIYAGDNGLALGQHGLMGKQNVYEHSVKVPLIMTGKNIPQAKINQEFVYLFDVFPTVCTLTNTQIPSTVQGHSLVGKDVKKRNAMLYAYKNYQRAVRKGDWKLIEYSVNGVMTTQLFNLRKDPFEMNNLADSKATKMILLSMKEELKKQRALNNDTFDLLKTGKKTTKN